MPYPIFFGLTADISLTKWYPKHNYGWRQGKKIGLRLLICFRSLQNPLPDEKYNIYDISFDTYANLEIIALVQTYQFQLSCFVSPPNNQACSKSKIGTIPYLIYGHPRDFWLIFLNCLTLINWKKQNKMPTA